MLCSVHERCPVLRRSGVVRGRSKRPRKHRLCALALALARRLPMWCRPRVGRRLGAPCGRLCGHGMLALHGVGLAGAERIGLLQPDGQPESGGRALDLFVAIDVGEGSKPVALRPEDRPSRLVHHDVADVNGRAESRLDRRRPTDCLRLAGRRRPATAPCGLERVSGLTSSGYARRRRPLLTRRARRRGRCGVG